MTRMPAPYVPSPAPSGKIRRIRRTSPTSQTSNATPSTSHWLDHPNPAVRANALMALRTAKSGKHAGQQFWGCTKYPECKGTHPIQRHPQHQFQWPHRAPAHPESPVTDFC